MLTPEALNEFIELLKQDGVSVTEAEAREMASKTLTLVKAVLELPGDEQTQNDDETNLPNQ